MVQHYHVICGLHGCMPSSNDVHTSHSQAKLGLQEVVKQLRDSGNRLRGSGDYYELTHKTDALVDYANIEPCQEKECTRKGYDSF